MRAPDTRARNTRLPRNARRIQLLSAAREVFVAQGYHAAAMDEIAERAGVSKPVLYQHFPGKRELYIALIDQHTAELLAAVRRALASTTDNKQRVAATIQAFFEFIDADGEAFRLVFESDLTNDDEVRALVNRASAAVAQAIADVIREDTGLPEQQAVLLGVALAGMANTTARYWVTTGKTIPREEADRLVTQLSWRGVRGFPKADGAPGNCSRPAVG
jgi:AcrR family transcriptional regulator